MRRMNAVFPLGPIYLLATALFSLSIASAGANGGTTVAPKKTAAQKISTPEKGPSDEKAWVLKLRTEQLGMIICHVTKNSFMAESSIGNFLADRKLNGFTIYNPVRKLYMFYTEDTLKKRFVIQSHQSDLIKKNNERAGWQYPQPKLVGTEMLHGVHTKVYERRNLFPMSYTDKWVVIRTWYMDQANFQQLPDGAAMIVSKISRSREVDRRFALRETTHAYLAKKDGKLIEDSPVREELSLVSLKPEPYNPKLFELPKGYTLCKSEVTLFAVDGVDGRRNW